MRYRFVREYKSFISRSLFLSHLLAIRLMWISINRDQKKDPTIISGCFECAVFSLSLLLQKIAYLDDAHEWQETETDSVAI